MFNIKIQCCALILLVVLHLLFRPYRKLNTLPNRVFQVTYYIILAGLIADILSVFLITYQDRLPKILVEVEAKTYLISLELTALLGLLYLISSVTSKMEKIRKWIRINFGVAAFFVILIYVLPIHLVGENNGEIVYSSGPSALATYISAAYFSIFVVLALVTKRKLLPTRQHRAILMWFCLWMVASIIQFFNPELLLVGYAGALGIIIIFFQSENPELYLDRYTGLFNSMGFFRYMDENYNANQKLSVISIRFEQTVGHEHSSDYSNNIVTSAANQFLSLRSAKVFKMLEDEVLMIFRDAEEEAFKVFSKNLQDVLLAPPAGHKAVLALAGIGGAFFLGGKFAILDPIAAVIVSFFIAKVAFEIGFPNIQELLEASLPPDVEEEIIRIIRNTDKVRFLHHLQTRKIGSIYAIDVHIKLDHDISLVDAHDVATEIEEKLRQKYGKQTQINIHMEPLSENENA